MVPGTVHPRGATMMHALLAVITKWRVKIGAVQRKIGTGSVVAGLDRCANLLPKGAGYRPRLFWRRSMPITMASSTKSR